MAPKKTTKKAAQSKKKTTKKAAQPKKKTAKKAAQPKKKTAKKAAQPKKKTTKKAAQSKKKTTKKAAKSMDGYCYIENIVAVAKKKSNTKKSESAWDPKDLLAKAERLREMSSTDILSESLLKSSRPGHEALDMSGKNLSMMDRSIQRAVILHGKDIMNQRVDKNLLKTEKEYTFLWTDRVAMWRFFSRYIEPAMKGRQDQVGYLVKHERQKIKNLSGIDITTANPFSCFEHAFKPVLDTWTPLMLRILRVFVDNNPNGSALREDFLSVANIAFLHALEKQAMAILGSLPRAQGIPFSKRLEFAIRKGVRCDLPDLTGPVRVPIESEQRMQMPTSVSLEALLGDGGYEK